jgi:hypothetical protein
MQLSRSAAVGTAWLRCVLAGPRRAAAIVLATWLCTAAQPGFGADTLRWKFKPGETLRYTMVQDTTQGMKAMGQEFKTSLNQTVDLHWGVKSVASDGVAELSQTIDRVRTKVDSPGAAFEFDSQSDKVPEGQVASLLTPLLKALVNAEFTFKMNARGELSDIKVPKKLIDTLKTAGPEATGGSMFSEEGLKNLISESSLVLPEGPVEKGKTWKQPARLPSPMLGTMVLDKTYTYQGAGGAADGVVTIGLDTKVSLEPAADSNVAVKISSQDGRGEVSFDPNAGRVVSSKIIEQLQLSLTIMGQEMEQSSKRITTMTLGK